MSKLGSPKGTIASSYGVANLLSGLFSDKVISVDVYDNGLVLNRKKSNETVLFDDIQKIQTSNFFAPISGAIAFELINSNNVKIADLSLAPDKKDAYLLLEAHRDFQLGSDFPGNIHTLSFNLGNVQIEQGMLSTLSKKEAESHALEDIEEFVYDKSKFYFTVKSTGHKLMVQMNKADNCLSTLEIGKIVMEKHKPKNLF